MKQPTWSLQTLFAALIIFTIVGLAGSVPFAMLATLIGGGAVGGDMWLLAAVLIGSWLPLKLFIDQQVKGQTMMQLPRRLSPMILVLSALVFMLLMPVLWGMMLPAFLVGAVAYALLEQQLLFAIVVGLGVQVVSLYRTSQREQAMGQTGGIFTRVQSMQDSFNIETITLTNESVQRSQEDTRYLGAGSDDDRVSDARDDDDRADTITIEPQSESRKDYDN